MIPQAALPHLDRQINELSSGLEGLDVPGDARDRLASLIHDEVASLGEAGQNRLRGAMVIPPEDYLDEMASFQRWTDIAHDHSDDPIIVRAHLMTQLYVALIWLRDSLLGPLASALPADAVTVRVIDFLRTGDRRRLRNAAAHGRWRYMDDFSGLECWDGEPPSHFSVPGDLLDAWQLLSRASTIAALLALTDP